nr:hypothetical protein [uncultured Brevundimonas sp.]
MRTALAFQPRIETLDMFIENKDRSPHPLRFVAPKESAMPTVSSEAWTFSQFSAALLLLAKELPNRVTIRQLLTFAMIVEEVSQNHSITIAEIRAKAGPDKGFKENPDGSHKLGKDGKPERADLLGQSIGRSYQVFLEPTKKEPDALGWLTVEENEDDRRQKFLRLTKEGEAVALKLARLLKSKP